MTTTTSRKAPAKPSKLDQIAASMRERIEGTGASWIHQRLDRGLELVLQRNIEENGAQHWRLALARPGVEPSADEISICRRSFGVPDASDWELNNKWRLNAKSKTATLWWIAEMYWYEAA